MEVNETTSPTSLLVEQASPGRSGHSGEASALPLIPDRFSLSGSSGFLQLQATFLFST
jgi:hypothetical protein